MEKNIFIRICTPSIALMNRLTYKVKIILLGSLVLAMSGSIISFLLNNLQTQADFSIKEQQGIEYINPIKNLMLDLQRYRENNPYISKDNINKDIEDIEKIDVKYNKTMKVEDKWSNLKKDLAKLSRNEKQTTDLITQAQAIMDQVTNQSNLILDPDLDTYYLMDSYCLRFSNIISKIFDLKKNGLGKISRRSFNQLELIRTSVLFEEQNEILKSNLAVIYGFNPSCKKELDEVYNKAFNANKSFLNMTNKLINGATIAPSEYAAAADKAIKTNKKADEIYADSLYNLAGKRVNKYVSQMPFYVLITLVSLLVLAYLCIGFYLSLVESVNAISNKLYAIANEVESTSDKLTQTSHTLAEGNTQQASAIYETASALEETSSMVNQNADNTRTAATLSNQAKDLAKKGSTEMSRLVESIMGLQNSSNEIAKINKVIDEIAFQTNILALNAAVEAARAGDSGKGFAVVAEEVRNLAQRSAEAAKSTSQIISGNIALSQDGTVSAQQTNQALNEINAQIQKVSEIVNEVAAASEEQNQGINQINNAMSQMRTVTQNNATIADDNTSVITDLTEQVEQMKLVINNLISLMSTSN